MAALVSVISAISGICSIVKFGESQFSQASADDSKLKIKIGLDYKGGLQNAGGDLPDVRLWNEAGKFIGMETDPGSVDDGSQGEVSIGSEGQQATYTLMSANSDAICIAYISMTWPDDSHYGWEGSWGKQCGGSWFWSNIYIDNQNYKPPCLWIDGDGDQPQTGVSMHLPEFVSKTGQVPKGKTPDYFCDNAPAFKLHTEDDPSVIDFWTLGGGNGSKLMSRSEESPPLDKRATKFIRPNSAKTTRRNVEHNKKRAGANKHRNKLVISDDAVNHPTATLCESPNSVGPDFANVADGQYCRMEDHTLWPLCDKKTKDNCFNMDTQNLVINGKATRDSAFDWVQDWSKPESD